MATKVFIQIKKKQTATRWADIPARTHEFTNRQDAATWARTTCYLMPELEIRLSYPHYETDKATDLSGSYYSCI